MTRLHVKLKHHHVIDFYRWMLEEQGWKRIDMCGWGEPQYRTHLETWLNPPPDIPAHAPNAFVMMSLNFADERDAVAFRLRYSDSEFVEIS